MIRYLLALFVTVALAYLACGGGVLPAPIKDGGASDSGEQDAGIDAGRLTTDAIGAEPVVVGRMQFANGFWAPDVEAGQLRFLWALHDERLQYFERSFAEGGIGEGAQPLFVVETPFSTQKSIHAVRSATEWSALPLFAGANPDRFPLHYLFWSPRQEPVIATSCDYAYNFTVGGSAEINEAWIAFDRPCTNECGAGFAAVLHRVPLVDGGTAEPACLFAAEPGGYARRILLHPEFRVGATFLDGVVRLFEFSENGSLLNEATAADQRIGSWTFWPGARRLLFEHRLNAPPGQFVPPEIREAEIVDGVLQVRVSAALDPLFMSLRSAVQTSHGVVLLGRPKPSIDGSGRQIVALVRDGVVVAQQLLPDLGPNFAQVVEVDGALFGFMEGRVPADGGTPEASIYGFRLTLVP